MVGWKIQDCHFHISTWMLIVMGWHGFSVVKFNLTEHPVLLHVYVCLLFMLFHLLALHLVKLHFAEFNFCNCPIFATSHHHMTKFRPWNLGQVPGTLIAAARAEAKRSSRCVLWIQFCLAWWCTVIVLTVLYQHCLKRGLSQALYDIDMIGINWSWLLRKGKNRLAMTTQHYHVTFSAPLDLLV